MGKHHSGLLLGIVAGTALGILFAPKKGKELREAIKKERREGGYGIESIKDGFVEMGREVVTTAKTAYDSDMVQGKIGQLKETAGEMVEEGRSRVQKATKKVAKRAKATVKTTAKMAKKKVGKFAKKRIAK